jgi:hypothetical protein
MAHKLKGISKLSDGKTDLKVDVDGPVRFGSNMVFQKSAQSATHQKSAQSATQPNTKGLAYANQSMAYGAYPGNQGFTQPYGVQSTAVPMYYGGSGVSIESLNQQLIQQNKLSYYNNINPSYRSQQPQSAGLSRKPPGFEFMAPKPNAYFPQPQNNMMISHNQSVQYAEYQPPLLQPQTPYYVKHCASPLVPPSTNYDINHKQQPQSAMIPNYTISDLETQGPTPIISHTDSQEGKIFEIVKKCEASNKFEDKIKYLEGSLCDMLFTQTGSRFIQKQLNEQLDETVDPNDQEAKLRKQQRIERFTSFILCEIGDKVNETMVDRYGNYFFQELISKCNDEQRLGILHSINTNFIEICTDKKGTHTVQRLIDMVSSSEEEKALHACVQGQVVKLSMDAQGTHVMQKYIKVCLFG